MDQIRDTLTRFQAAQVLGVSKATIRRLQKDGTLTSVIDQKGTNRFDRGQVEALARERDAGKAPKPDAKKRDDILSNHGDSQSEGKTASRVFAAFEKGLNVVEAVIACEADPSTVQRLYRDWLGMKGSLIVSAAERVNIEQRLGRQLAQEGFANFVGSLVLIFKEVSHFTFPCAECGKPIYLGRKIWKVIRDSGVLDDETHPKCGCNE